MQIFAHKLPTIQTRPPQISEHAKRDRRNPEHLQQEIQNIKKQGHQNSDQANIDPRDSEYVETGAKNSEHANFRTQNSDNANTATQVSEHTVLS
jgi:hypothetical protein